MKLSDHDLLIALLAGALSLTATCDGGSAGDGNGNGNGNENAGLPCNHDGVCDPGEPCGICPDCCVTYCGNPGGSGHDFLVAKLLLPTDNRETSIIGTDMNGDGEIDNKLVALVMLIAQHAAPGFDVNTLVNEAIAEGELLLIARLTVDQFSNDDILHVTLLQGEVTDATPVFDGTDVVGISPHSTGDAFLCGTLTDDVLEAGPGALALPPPSVDAEPITLTLAMARMIGQTLETGWHDVTIGFGLSTDALESDLYPAIVSFLNREIGNDPAGELATTVLALLDGACDDSVEGCSPLPARCAQDDEITLDELRCNAPLADVLSPDLSVESYGELDHLSVGLRIVSAVPVTVR